MNIGEPNSLLYHGMLEDVQIKTIKTSFSQLNL